MTKNILIPIVFVAISAGMVLVACSCDSRSNGNNCLLCTKESVEASSSCVGRKVDRKTPSVRLLNELIKYLVLDYECRLLDSQRTREYYSIEGLPYDSGHWDWATRWAPISVISEADVWLFVDLGPSAVPVLLEHVDDCSLRCQCTEEIDPRSSGIPDKVGSCVSVGKICCYLTEAILRGDPFFTTTGNWRYTSPSIATDEYDECEQLHRAAQEYERWFDRCYDKTSGKIACTNDDLPDIPWEME